MLVSAAGRLEGVGQADLVEDVAELVDDDVGPLEGGGRRQLAGQLGGGRRQREPAARHHELTRPPVDLQQYSAGQNSR